jgi:cytoskeleton protein RodZ
VPFGRDLQQERDSLGVPLEAIADATKVSLRNLRALEADDFETLPRGVFQRGIVRSYCRFLGLDEDLWLDKFARLAEASAGETDWAEFAENVKRARVPGAPSDGLRWWGVLAMCIALAAAGFSVWKYVVHPRMHPAAARPASSNL